MEENSIDMIYNTSISQWLLPFNHFNDSLMVEKGELFPCLWYIVYFNSSIPENVIYGRFTELQLPKWYCFHSKCIIPIRQYITVVKNMPDIPLCFS